MVKEIVKIIDPIGLHARPAGQLAAVANKFKSSVSVIFNEKTGNAKSIISLMSLAISKNSSITITCDGEDEVAAMEAIKNFLVEAKLI